MSWIQWGVNAIAQTPPSLLPYAADASMRSARAIRSGYRLGRQAAGGLRRARGVFSDINYGLRSSGSYNRLDSWLTRNEPGPWKPRPPVKRHYTSMREIRLRKRKPRTWPKRASDLPGKRGRYRVPRVVKKPDIRAFYGSSRAKKLVRGPDGRYRMVEYTHRRPYRIDMGRAQRPKFSDLGMLAAHIAGKSIRHAKAEQLGWTIGGKKKKKKKKRVIGEYLYTDKSGNTHFM
jgi:hypothetical protein